MSPVEFIKNGFSVLCEASQRNYRGSNSELDALRKELFRDTNGMTASAIDKRNIISDSRRVAADMKKVIYSNYPK